MKTQILSILIFFIAKSQQKTALETIIQKRNAKHSKKLPPVSNSRILQPEILNNNNTHVPQHFATGEADLRVFALFGTKDCEIEICTLKEIIATSDSKKQAREKLQRYTNQCRFNPCDLSGTQACIQSWNHRRRTL